MKAADRPIRPAAKERNESSEPDMSISQNTPDGNPCSDAECNPNQMGGFATPKSIEREEPMIIVRTKVTIETELIRTDGYTLAMDTNTAMLHARLEALDPNAIGDATAFTVKAQVDDLVELIESQADNEA